MKNKYRPHWVEEKQDRTWEVVAIAVIALFIFALIGALAIRMDKVDKAIKELREAILNPKPVIPQWIYTNTFVGMTNELINSNVITCSNLTVNGSIAEPAPWTNPMIMEESPYITDGNGMIHERKRTDRH